MGTHVEGSPTNSATTPDQPSFVDTSESSLVLSIVLGFTVLNTVGIIIMISMLADKNNRIESFKRFLCI